MAGNAQVYVIQAEYPGGFTYTAQQMNTQSHHYGDELMSIDTTQHRRFGAPALVLMLLLGTACSEKETASTQEAAPAQASTETPAADNPADTQTASADGQKIYQKSCQACHATGAAGAPKLGDKDAWAPRITKGNDALLSSVTNGLKAMPPKGTCMSCSEDELRAAMEYMVGQGS
jgi:cytochrome c5